MVAAGIVMDLAFTALGWIPIARPDMAARMELFSFNYTFVLNLLFALLALSFAWLSRRQPVTHSHCEHHAHRH
jgi:hypothetical protein